VNEPKTAKQFPGGSEGGVILTKTTSPVKYPAELEKRHAALVSLRRQRNRQAGGQLERPGRPDLRSPGHLVRRVVAKVDAQIEPLLASLKKSSDTAGVTLEHAQG